MSSNFQTVKQWEAENGKPYPILKYVWHYDAYGESWVRERWDDVKSFYEEERLRPQGEAAWDFSYEPVVYCENRPQWGESGIPLLARTV